MKTDEIDETILAAKRFLNQHSPPKKETTESVIKAAKAKQGEYRDYLEEENGIFWPSAPPGMYLNKEGIPMQKGFYSHK